ncbi:MAG: [protein-PII] uridylyltransferase [Casimicrobiaceae bacterium]|nr:[protein-PII] uridylyltransferase [Casimicrobiaceae bacterium]
MSFPLAQRRNEHRALVQSVFSSLASPAQVTAALRQHAAAVDRMLIELWQTLELDGSRLALAAVGGYGRAELYPHSDIDVLILTGSEELPAADRERIEAFLSRAWDLGLDLAHSVRSVPECLRQAAAEVTVATALLERRWLTGTIELWHELDQQWQARFDALHFIRAKRFEQQERHARYADTAYNLEPNVKESPGGLRDIQTVLWIAQALGRGASLEALEQAGELERSEREQLAADVDQLRYLRVHLHCLARRREDRLVFELQTQLAEHLGIAPERDLRSSEVLMKHYYQHARRIRLANEILLDALTSDPAGQRIPLPGTPFVESDDCLDLARAGEPLSAEEILHAYQLLYHDRRYRAFTPDLRRAIVRSVRELPQSAFLKPRALARFRAMLSADQGVYHALRDMNELGVLGCLIPPWRAIVGQMQHDLFHVYTVDQHILMVLRNMRRFLDPAHVHEYPLCSQLIAEFPKPVLLYLACLFHDIAKGRGGDHSLLGMQEARAYCQQLGLSDEESALVAWLVEHHLRMSAVAQKQDIADPAVVQAFAQFCGTEERLVALYLLTVADIRGTSPKVWNRWKAHLLEQLFYATRAQLRAASERRSVFDLLAERWVEARERLALQAIDPSCIDRLWNTLDSVYLQRHNADEIAWHARHLHWRVETQTPVVCGRLVAGGEGIQVLIYTRDAPRLFLRVMSVFARLGLSVLDARVHTTRIGYALDTFTVVQPSPGTVADRDLAALIEHELAKALSDESFTLPPLGRVTRQQRHQAITPRITITGDENSERFTLEIVAADRTGLLAHTAKILADHGVSIHSARVNTLGARAEDVFVISGGRLNEEASRIALETELAEALA